MKSKSLTRGILVVGSISGLIIGLLGPQAASATYQPAGGSDSIPVALDNPSTIGDVDMAGNPIRVLSTHDSGAETTTTSLLASGEVATTVVQRVPKEEAFDLTREEANELPPLGVTADPPGPVREELVPEVLDEDLSAWEVSFAYTVSETTAAFRWFEAADSYEVWRDDMLVSSGTSVSTALVDGLAPGESYDFTIVGSVLLSNELIPSTRTITIETSREDSENYVDSAEPFTYQEWNTAITYRTFIEPASVSAAMCNWADSSYTFDGDGRSYRIPWISEPYDESFTYRTLMFANINWDNPPIARFVTVKNVGESITRQNGSIVDRSYAKVDQMTFDNASISTSYASFVLNHRAANPHCMLFDINYGGAIEYNVHMRMWRSGTVEALGARRPVPHHELYVRWNKPDGTSFWQSMLQRPNEGFICLTGACLNDPIGVSRQY